MLVMLFCEGTELVTEALAEECETIGRHDV